MGGLRLFRCADIWKFSRGKLNLKTMPTANAKYNAQDFYRHRLDFTETITDVAPEEWSGVRLIWSELGKFKSAGSDQS